MVKRRKATRRIRTVARKVYRKVKSGMSKPEGMIPFAVGYGALRQQVSNMLIPLTSKIPMGMYADEVGMGILSYFAAKKGTGMVKKIGYAGLMVESARVGQTLISQGLGGITGTATPQTAKLSFR